MIKIEKTEVVGWESAIRGMRNPMNSWEKSDSKFFLYNDTEEEMIYKDILDEKYYWNAYDGCPFQGNNLTGFGVVVGPNDRDLMLRLNKGGPVEAKYRRMIVVYADITAPLYWWKEFDTYKVGTVANSCSTMHKIHSKEFTIDDFSTEHLNSNTLEYLKSIIFKLNESRNDFLESKNKADWWQMIQLLPSSYNQKRTVMMNYEVLAGIYPKRKNHKLDEWHTFCDWIKTLPLSEIITGEEE